MPLLTDPTALLRLTDAHYSDGLSGITRIDDAATIASVVFDQDGDMPDPGGLSALFVDWGQFLDHDLDLTRDASGEFLQVPGLVGPFQRSVYDPETGTDTARAPVNEITSGIDASMVYGSTDDRTAALRSFEGGRLRVSEGANGSGELMPLAGPGDVMGGANATDSPIFLAGDIRANENLSLTVVHTLFLREHNHWADRLAAAHPDWSDEQIFQTARGIIEYEIQSITYRDWLPKLLSGNDDNPAWSLPLGADVDGQISVEFSTAAFRFGHTMVTSDVPVLLESGAAAPGVDLAIKDVVFNPRPLIDGYFDHLLRGQAAMTAQEFDGKMIDDLNFFLRAPDGLTGFSLAALNILRSRDHGIAPYLDVRAALLGDVDLASIDPSDFSVITSDSAVQAELAQVYDSVFDVDLWVGGLVEDRAPGAQVGPVFAYILIEQFQRTQAADDSFLSLPDTLDAAMVAEVEAATIHDVMLRNTDITHLQDDPFLAAGRIYGSQSANAVLGSAASEFLFGLGGDDQIFAGAGDDTIIGGTGADRIDGEAGYDTAVYSGALHCYQITLHRDGRIEVMDKRAGGDGTDLLEHVEQLSFADSDWLVQAVEDVVQLSADQFRSLVELYIATFNRAPDSEGLFFWGNALANGTPLDEIAALFFDQDETRALYPDLTDPAGFVADVYANVLGRTADAEGAAFWTGVLDSGAVAPADFVLAILNGVHAPAPQDADGAFVAQQSADRDYLIGKTDVGVYFSAVKGMNDVDEARAVMQMYDGTTDSMKGAKSMTDSVYLDALDPEGGSFQLSLVGVVDNPFQPTLDNFFFG
jgi:peroxidase